MTDTTNDIGTFFVGFVIGGLVGAATALLLAPQSGEETRALIRDKSIELKDRTVEAAESAYEDARQRADEALAEMRIRADELSDRARMKVSTMQKHGQVVVEEPPADTGVKPSEAASSA